VLHPVEAVELVEPRYQFCSAPVAEYPVLLVVVDELDWNRFAGPVAWLAVLGSVQLLVVRQGREAVSK
jgi:hypothetical protein